MQSKLVFRKKEKYRYEPLFGAPPLKMNFQKEEQGEKQLAEDQDRYLPLKVNQANAMVERYVRMVVHNSNLLQQKKKKKKVVDIKLTDPNSITNLS